MSHIPQFRGGTGPFPIIRVYDNAIDTKAMGADLDRYYMERDLSLLRFHDGKQPSVFWARPLTRSEWREVHSKTNQGDAYEAAFRMGLQRVERLIHPDGQVRDWVRPEDSSGRVKVLSDEILDQYFSEADIQEVGMVIHRRAFLPPGSAVTYLLLPTSFAVLTGNSYRLAAQTRDSAKSVRSKQPAADQPVETPASSHAGDASTDATATGSATP
jgi:hypothetical protein